MQIESQLFQYFSEFCIIVNLLACFFWLSFFFIHFGQSNKHVDDKRMKRHSDYEFTTKAN